MIDDLPQERIRTMGAATDSYLTGEFKVAGKPAYLLIYAKSSDSENRNAESLLLYCA